MKMTKTTLLAGLMAATLLAPVLADSEGTHDDTMTNGGNAMPMGGPQAGMPMMGGPGGGRMMGPPQGGMPMMGGPRGGGMPMMMQRRQMMMQHMQTMEQRLGNIEKLLRELVELQKKQ